MDDLLRPIYEARIDREETLSVLMLDKTNSPLTEPFDAVMIILKKDKGALESTYDVEHYDLENKKIAVHIIGEHKFLEWLAGGKQRRYLLWILNGRILFDRNGYIAKFRKELLDFPVEKRKRKITIEFAKLIRSFSYGKELYEGKQYLDAFNQMVKALHHLARLSVIEHGYYPEITVWSQVKRIDTEVYTLYLELVESSERIEKRVQLLLLALEFAISSRARIGSSYLIEVMKSRKEPWTITELANEPKLKGLTIDLGLLLQYLKVKHIVQIDSEEVDDQSIRQRKYKIR
ncbi:nucleotidyltransferase-like protein [Schinkia sp. CFF1]